MGPIDDDLEIAFSAICVHNDCWDHLGSHVSWDGKEGKTRIRPSPYMKVWTQNPTFYNPLIYPKFSTPFYIKRLKEKEKKKTKQLLYNRYKNLIINLELSGKI